MGLDLNKVNLIYDNMVLKTTDTLNKYFRLDRLDNENYANVIMKVLDTIVTTSINVAQQDNLIDKQIEEINARKLLTDAQIKKTKIESDILQQQLDLDKDLKTAQTNEIKKQTELIDSQIKDLKYTTEQLKPLEKDITQQKVAESKADVKYKLAQVDIAKQDLSLKKEQIQSDTELKKAQVNVYNRQVVGFNDKARLDLIKMQLDAWSMMFSSGLLTEKPSIISNDSVSILYNAMEKSIINSNNSNFINYPESIIVTFDNPQNAQSNTTYIAYIDNYQPKYTYSVTTTENRLQVQLQKNKVAYVTPAADTDTSKNVDTIIIKVSNGSFSRSLKQTISWS